MLILGSEVNLLLLVVHNSLFSTVGFFWYTYISMCFFSIDFCNALVRYGILCYTAIYISLYTCIIVNDILSHIYRYKKRVLGGATVHRKVGIQRFAQITQLHVNNNNNPNI